MGRITLIIILFLATSCNKNSNLTRNTNKDRAVFVKKNTFISSPGIYYFRDISIVVKEFKDNTIVYGIFDYYNKLLYQRNINNSISNYMKWAIYVDNQGQVWFYNVDYQETNVFILKQNRGVFIDNYKKLPPVPKQLKDFINKK